MFAWEEEELGDLRLLLQNVTLQVLREDRWNWRLEPSNIYSVCSAYNFLNVQAPLDHMVAVSSLWPKDVPLKVVLFVWRLFCDRLPTKDNLHRQRVLENDAQICVGGCGMIETSAHLFLHCNLFSSVWIPILRWFGVSAVLPFNLADHFNQFSFLGGASKQGRSHSQHCGSSACTTYLKCNNIYVYNILITIV